MSHTHTQSDTFVINHFTGEQSYAVTDDWPSINSTHSVSHDLLDVFKTSVNLLVQEMAEVYLMNYYNIIVVNCHHFLLQTMSTCSPDVLPTDHTPSDHAPLLTSRARVGLSALCETVTVCTPHFVLCIDTASTDGEMVGHSIYGCGP